MVKDDTVKWCAECQGISGVTDSGTATETVWGGFGRTQMVTARRSPRGDGVGVGWTPETRQLPFGFRDGVG
jgi:hypothetical protein